ncbi:YgaP family membrane protein [Natronosalvus amylolyticus]|uniref:YgaP family membrane protein n=1 Tax=Natronosalvus amylolyticus TaxID=2961994 RepID=UPI0020C9AB5B|nr:DUF2892 domain-containing protein [Natronosalvus amylolyticus]
MTDTSKPLETKSDPMEPNVGGFDRTVRITLGVLALSLALAIGSSTAFSADTRVLSVVVSLLLGGFLLTSALTRRCLGNRLLGIDTCER